MWQYLLENHPLEPFSECKYVPKVQLRAVFGQYLHSTGTRLQDTDESEISAENRVHF